MSPLLYQLSYTATPSLRLIMPQKPGLPAFGAHLACVVSDEGAETLFQVQRLRFRRRRSFLGGRGGLLAGERRAGLHPSHDAVECASDDARFLLAGPHHGQAVEALVGPWPHLDFFVFA